MLYYCSALSSDDPNFFKLLRYDLQALGNATAEGTDEEDPPGNDEGDDEEYESLDEEEGEEDDDEEDVNIDPIRVYDTILQKGRFPTSIISKVDLMQQEATNSILDEEFWEWVNQSREVIGKYCILILSIY
jgi:TATA-binding protein-associated factor Taf7